MQMQKSFDCFGNDQSYASHHEEESWNSRNNNHHLNHYQTNPMNMNHNGYGAHHSPHHLARPGGGAYGAHYSPSAPQAYGAHYPPSMGNGHHHGHGLGHGGHGYGHGHGHGHGGQFSESSEYESHKEVHNGGGRMKMEEMRYERRKYGGGGNGEAYGNYPSHGRPNNMMNSVHKVEWGVKGV